MIRIPADWKLYAAVVLPVLGVLALTAQAEWKVRHGPEWVIPIEGYDPRDLIFGHYLLYRYDFNWQGQSDCGPRPRPPGTSAPQSAPSIQAGCCLCLTRGPKGSTDPAVRQTSCTTARSDCEGWLRSEVARPPLRYFVPERQATVLERSLRTRSAALRLRLSSGKPAVDELLIDEKPWRQVIPQSP
jgi:hypothetical protein